MSGGEGGDSSGRLRELVQAWVRPAVRTRQPYPVADATGLLKLDQMENPFDWPGPALRQAWQEALGAATVNRYPDAQAALLKQALRQYLGMAPDEPLLVGNGSDEIIQMLMVVFGGPGRTVLAPEPSFVMYRSLAEMNGLDFVGVDLDPATLTLDVEAMCAAIARHRPALVFLASPNNPTGTVFAEKDLRRVIEAAPGVVVLDEAYAAFAGFSHWRWVHDYPQLLVMQTLSKLGYAGLRIGYLTGAPAWLAEIDKVRLPYNVGVLPQLATCLMLGEQATLTTQLALLQSERERLTGVLRAWPGVHVWQSATNFLLVRLPVDAVAVHAHMRAHGVLVKCVARQHPLLERCLRITVSTPEENERCLAALAAGIRAGSA